MMLLFLTGCGTEKKSERKEENADNVGVEKGGSEEQKKKIPIQMLEIRFIGYPKKPK